MENYIRYFMYGWVGGLGSILAGYGLGSILRLFKNISFYDV